VDIVNLDYDVDPFRARAVLPGVCLDGNLRPLSFVVGEPGEIDAEARRLLGSLSPAGGFILSSGCEIPPESRPECVEALCRAVVPAA
jgi:uroporphyrinogen decarboxylase